MPNKKLSYHKQIVHQQCTHSNNSKFYGESSSQQGQAYGTPVVSAFAGTINFSVG